MSTFYFTFLHKGYSNKTFVVPIIGDALDNQISSSHSTPRWRRWWGWWSGYLPFVGGRLISWISGWSLIQTFLRQKPLTMLRWHFTLCLTSTGRNLSTACNGWHFYQAIFGHALSFFLLLLLLYCFIAIHQKYNSFIFSSTKFFWKSNSNSFIL